MRVGMKKKLLFILLILSTLVIFSSQVLSIDFSEEIFEEKYYDWIEFISQPEIEILSYSGPRFECQEFKEIVQLGIPAIPFIIRKIEKDLKGQFLWKAIEEISKTKIEGKYDKIQNKVIFPDYPDLKEGENIWLYWYYEGYKLTPELYDKYYSLYKETKSKKDPESQKKAIYYYRRIRKLGIQIIPLIIETAKKGDDDLLQLLPYLTNNNISKEKLSKIKSREERIKYCEEWWKENKEDWTIPFGKKSYSVFGVYIFWK